MKKAISGLRAWMVQRFTAVYLLAFFLFAIVYFAVSPPDSYQAWRAWITGPVVLVATALFFITLFLHAWVGLRDVVMDYVRVLPLRIAVLALLALVLTGFGVWVLRILVAA